MLALSIFLGSWLVLNVAVIVALMSRREQSPISWKK
jgi:hypothetical protein